MSLTSVRVFAVLAAIAGAVLAVRAQGPERQFFISVRDSSGAPMTDLTPDALEVLQNGAACKTVKLEPIAWPMKLTVLVDNGSKSSTYLLDVRTGLRNLVEAVPEGVEMSLLTVAPQPRWIVRPTKDGGQMLNGVGLIAPDGGTARFFDGIAEAADRYAKDKNKFLPVIIAVMSDIGGTDVVLEYQQNRLRQNLIAKAGTVHFVLLRTGTEMSPANGVTGSTQTQIGLNLTRLTGGRFETIGASSRLTTLLGEIGQQIASSNARQAHEYRATYDCPKGGNADAPLSISVRSSSSVMVALSVDGHLP